MGDKVKKRKRNRGFTLVEVLVAAAILSLVVTPILSSFVTVARINAKSRRKLSATTIANSVMESVKGFELSQVATECGHASAVGFHVVAGFSGTTAEINPASYADISSCVSSVGGEWVFTPRDTGNYAFRISGVRMDGTTYDVLLTYTKNTTRTNDSFETPGPQTGSTVTASAAEVLTGMGVRVLTYYDVEIKVFRGGAGFNSTPLATLTGSKADYTPVTTGP